MNYTSLHGSYYPNNYGDVLILAIQSEWIKEITGNEVVLPYAAEVYRKYLNSTKIRGKEGIQKSSHLVYGAGGYLGEPSYNKIKWTVRFLQNHIRPIYHAKKNNVRIAINATGSGPATNFLSKTALKYIADNASIISVRDQESKKYLVSYGVDSKKIKVTTDVALTLTSDLIPSNSLKSIETDYQFDDSKIKLGIHIGANRKDSKLGQNVQYIIDEVVEFLSKQNNIQPFLIIDNDNVIQNEAVEHIKATTNKNIPVYKHIDIWETSALLSKLDVVITNKLHIGIVNYALGNIPISFPYHPKTKRFYKQIGLDHLCTPIEKVKKGQTFDILNKVSTDILNGKKEDYHTMREIVYNEALQNKLILNKFLNNSNEF